MLPDDLRGGGVAQVDGVAVIVWDASGAEEPEAVATDGAAVVPHLRLRDAEHRAEQLIPLAQRAVVPLGAKLLEQQRAPDAGRSGQVGEVPLLRPL